MALAPKIRLPMVVAVARYLPTRYLDCRSKQKVLLSVQAKWQLMELQLVPGRPSGSRKCR
jgi:hypothetical protein